MRQRSPRTRTRLTAGALAAVGLVFAWHAREVEPITAAAGRTKPLAAEKLARIKCATCHKFPAPDILPRAAWRSEIAKMAMISAGTAIPQWGAGGAPPPPLSADDQAILEYYERAAPPALAPLERWPPVGEGPVRFVRRAIPFKDAITQEPAVANVKIADLDGDGRPEILACDMRQGVVIVAHADEIDRGAFAIAQIPHPDHISVVDLDGDGRLDLLVADLGEFFPGDHEKGAVTWLRALPGGGFRPFTIGGFPRVADVEAVDVDGHGHFDLAVAAFGWHLKGEMALLRNHTVDWNTPVFERTRLDPRAGAIHLVPADIDGDGHVDLVGVIAQEHESVVAFLGDGKGNFGPARTLYAAPHPNWGTTGIQVVDLDRDGDLDIIVTNGDMFDDDILKPYHGIQWLENKGNLRFEVHPLAKLAGAHRAVAVDLDGDGDLDIVASAFTGVAAGPATADLPSLVWLEQTKPGTFVRHTIAVGTPMHATLDVGDVDGDGDIDIVTGIFRLQGTSEDWLEIWENQTRTPASRRAAMPVGPHKP